MHAVQQPVLAASSAQGWVLGGAGAGRVDASAARQSLIHPSSPFHPLLHAACVMSLGYFCHAARCVITGFLYHCNAVHRVRPLTMGFHTALCRRCVGGQITHVLARSSHAMPCCAHASHAHPRRNSSSRHTVPLFKGSHTCQATAQSLFQNERKARACRCCPAVQGRSSGSSRIAPRPSADRQSSARSHG